MSGGWSLTEELRRQNRERALAARDESRTVPFGFSPRSYTRQISLFKDSSDSPRAEERAAA